MTDETPAKNTNRELYREPKGDLPSDYYANSVHVTEQGHIGMSVGGSVYQAPIADWHAAMARWHAGLPDAPEDDDLTEPSPGYQPPPMAFDKTRPAPQHFDVATRCEIDGCSLAHDPACGVPCWQNPEVRCNLAGGHLGAHSHEYGAAGVSWSRDPRPCPVRPATGDLSCTKLEGHAGLHENFQGIAWATPTPEPDRAEPLALAEDSRADAWSGVRLTAGESIKAGERVSFGADGVVRRDCEPLTRGLDLAVLAELNAQRCQRWHPAESEPWTLADWSNAMCGEAGEAANMVKKLRRIETRTDTGPWSHIMHNTGREVPHDRGTESRVLAKGIGLELADTVIYADLLAQELTRRYGGYPLSELIVTKFNAVSHREGYPERLTPP